ncbi:MAG: Inner membrane protein YibH [Candidatus Udaeobacter sp.]|nr:MAG: Inner membrane protein YibH [Candidatus Udaeobacter sp.]
MEVILLGIYGFFVWLIFYKFKWLPMNFTAAVITITLPIVAMMALFLLLNIAAPATDDVRAMNYVIPIVPRITGQVTEVPIQPNRPIKKGDVLFKIDPIPFEAAVKAAEATLRGLQDQLKNATAKKAALTPRIDLAKKRVEQFTALAATGAGKRADLEQAQSDLGNLESEFLAADATEAQAGAQILKAEADLRDKKFDLEGCVHVAPQRARSQPCPATRRARDPVRDNARDELHPGGRSVAAGILPAKRTALRRTRRRSGNLYEGVSGPHHHAKVDSILWATAQGQLPISGNLRTRSCGTRNRMQCDSSQMEG